MSNDNVLIRIDGSDGTYRYRNPEFWEITDNRMLRLKPGGENGLEKTLHYPIERVLSIATPPEQNSTSSDEWSDTILHTISELEEESEDGVLIEYLFWELSKRMDISWANAKNQLSDLMKAGEVYKPESNRVRTV